MPDTADDADKRKEHSRLRSIMAEPGNVYLARADGRAWLTDQFVIVDVTGFSAVKGLDDGWYRIIASGANAGLRPRNPGRGLNIASWLKEIRRRDYVPVIPTEISFTDSEARAFLLFAEVPGSDGAVRYPVAMNEDVWRAFRLAWPDAALSHPGYDGPFRVSVPGNGELGYVEPVQIPARLHRVAIAVADAYLSPHNNHQRKGAEQDDDDAEASGPAG